ncbi:phosphate ABC transporter permease PstA [Helicobacter muridarum]|uniref:Phosphate transport system permease protein PstA n=1 Tax=Helicobacter muridarum TaxID=216 RepID=A0A099TWW9_9HELI|nr:phosphate ABC transporter permease PstA [Helicobacter muridarum]TLE00008.1 phosphate ABC transporter permease PstA [Helicobacter muridarum]STQ87082.1 phosphate ABC transporter [Helicobacter muridarum]
MRIDRLSLLLNISLKLSIILVLGIFVLLVGFIFFKGIGAFSFKFLEWQYNSNNISMMPAIINTLQMIIFALLLSIPFGIFGAIFLTEYSHKKSKIISFVQIVSETLVGIPSIVYGLFGYLAFVVYFGFKTSIIAGVLTLSIMILPLILRSTQEALLNVPESYKEASFALGISKLRTIFYILLPAAIPGILAGIILSIGRIIGESAALLYTSGSVAQMAGLFDSGRTLSVHLYALSSEGLYINEAYSSAMILILLVLLINICSNLIAKKFTRN